MSSPSVREHSDPKKGHGIILSIDDNQFFLTREQTIDLCISLADPVKGWGWYQERDGFERHMPDDWRFLKEGERLESGDHYGIGMNFQVGVSEDGPPYFFEGHTVTKKMLSAFPRRRREVCQTCRKAYGEKRTDNGLGCGVHCDKCFNKMVSEARSKSW